MLALWTAWLAALVALSWSEWGKPRNSHDMPRVPVDRREPLPEPE
jgi:hypothetical protein